VSFACTLGLPLQVLNKPLTSCEASKERASEREVSAMPWVRRPTKTFSPHLSHGRKNNQQKHSTSQGDKICTRSREGRPSEHGKSQSGLPSERNNTALSVVRGDSQVQTSPLLWQRIDHLENLGLVLTSLRLAVVPVDNLHKVSKISHT
jgi:hypothetical protein